METEEFGEFIKRKRKEKNWTQKRLSNEAGLASSYISHLEKGNRKKPTHHTIRKIASALDLSTRETLDLLQLFPDEIIEEEEEETNPHPTLNLEGLTDEDIKEVEKLIELLKIKNLYQSQNKKN
ncbi:helix-turn-helix transcriptional regulator [Bacillus sp. FSL R5-0293]|uniref:helix-turn-helix domain-containing protein n=1 Tax=Bacillus sp. FSL R5-0293 TaxID=2954584 RepID=UPI0030F594D7